MVGGFVQDVAFARSFLGLPFCHNDRAGCGSFLAQSPSLLCFVSFNVCGSLAVAGVFMGSVKSQSCPLACSSARKGNLKAFSE